MKFARQVAAPVFYFAFAVLAMMLCLLKPMHNWDMIGYIAAAKSFEENDIQALHRFTFDQLRKSVSEKEYEALASPGGEDAHTVFRRTMSRDFIAFGELLQGYQIRPVYTASVYLLYSLGVNIAYATHLVSGFAVATGILFLYLLSSSFLSRPLVYVVPPLSIIYGVLDLARYSTPDGLAFCAVVISAYLLLKRRETLLLLLLPILIGIRTDLILFVGPFCGLLVLEDRPRRWLIATSGLASIIIYAAIAYHWSNVGWATTFYFVFVHVVARPVSSAPALTAYDYFDALVHGVKGLPRNREFMLYTIVAAYSLFLIRLKGANASVLSGITSHSSILAIVSVIYVGSHFILFPAMLDRYFAGQYLTGTLALLLMASEIEPRRYLAARQDQSQQEIHGKQFRDIQR